MKTLSLLLAAAGGAGVLFHNQLQSRWNAPPPASQSASSVHQAPEGVYYLRTGCQFNGADGAAVRWSPGQELRTTQAPGADGLVTLTDGANTWQVAQNAVTRDMDDAAALRQMDANNRSNARAAAIHEVVRQAEAARPTDTNRLTSGEFRRTILDAPAARMNQPENIVSRVEGPGWYGPTYIVSGGQVAAPQSRAQTTRAVPAPSRTRSTNSSSTGTANRQ